MKDRNQALTELAHSLLRPDLAADLKEAAVRQFVANPPPDVDQMLALRALDDESPPTALAVEDVKRIMAHPIPVAFTTQRLRVFQMPIGLKDCDGPARMLFVGFWIQDKQTPRVVASAVIGFYPHRDKGLTPSCDWVEVAASYRGQRLGMELLDGIERHTGRTLRLIDAEVDFIQALAQARRERRAGQTIGSMEVGGDPV